MKHWTPLSRQQIAARIAKDVPEGWYVNLGIGVPTLVADYVPGEREVIFHSENGVLGIGPKPSNDNFDPWLINAGKEYVTLEAGGSYFHHADSFAMIRGQHLDLCILGAYEVSAGGDLANWARSENDSLPAVGGAMDLAVGAQRVWIAMQHSTKDGSSRVVQQCSYPLTAKGRVQRIYTDLAVLDINDHGVEVSEMIEGLTFDELQARTDARLTPKKNT